MSAATVALIISGIQAAIAAAPQVKELAISAKNFIAGMFTAGLITKEVQDQAHAHVDAVCAAALAGQVPPAWTVEADPS
jgi:hypothetical protein